MCAYVPFCAILGHFICPICLPSSPPSLLTTPIQTHTHTDGTIAQPDLPNLPTLLRRRVPLPRLLRYPLHCRHGPNILRLPSKKRQGPLHQSRGWEARVGVRFAGIGIDGIVTACPQATDSLLQGLISPPYLLPQSLPRALPSSHPISIKYRLAGPLSH